MSILTNKRALLIGSKNVQLSTLIESLTAAGVLLSEEAYDQVAQNFFDNYNADFVLVNNTTPEQETIQFLRNFSEILVERAIPVFVLTEDTPEAIQQALSFGAADCITPQEDASAIIAKISAVFGHSLSNSTATAIDISPLVANVTKKGIRVYIVEDDPLLRNLLSLKLDKTHFPYAFSTDGSNIVPALRQFKPDIVILDLMLPGRSGFEVLADIKADSSVSAVPVIVFSNQDSPDDRAKAHELGAKGFYVKAMTDLSELIETVESVAK